MSRKTDNIYKSITEIQKYSLQIEEINKNLNNRELDDVQFKLQEQIKNLKFWIDSLYAQNGKSTSTAKKNASKENGKKGGRPPKKVTELRQKISDLKDNVIPELEKSKKTTLDFDEEKRLEDEIDSKTAELNRLESELSGLLK